MFGNQFNQNPYDYKTDSPVDPYSENFDYNEYKRRWVMAIKQPDVYITLIIAIAGILLALSIFVWPCTSRFKIRAIVAFFITYMSSQSFVKKVMAFINNGEYEKK